MAQGFSSLQNFKNVLFNITSFILQFAISLYISPLIVSRVGASAYGFLGLANDFVAYAGIIATVFNSVAARFIAGAYYKEDYDKASAYFNSLIVANVALSGVFGIASVLFVPHIEGFLAVPADILMDVKLTFALVFGSYIVSLITTVFTTSTYISNRTDIQGVRNIVQYIIRFALAVALLNFVSVRIYWVALSSLIATVVVAVINVRLTSRLTPGIKLGVRRAKREYVVELAKSGVWMALTSISVILLRGLDLTIANVMIGDHEMGLLSIARTMPNNVTSAIGTLAPLFTPMLIARYVSEDTDAIIAEVGASIRWLTMILYAPISVFIVYSHDFYLLWQGSLSSSDLMLVTLTSTITIVQAYFDSTTATMAQLSVVVNRLRAPVIVSFTVGLASFVIEMALLSYTDMGLYAIVLPTTVLMIARYVLFNSFYAAHCLSKPYLTFWPTAGRSWASIPLLLLVSLGIKLIIQVTSWTTLLASALLALVACWAVLIALYGRTEAKKVTSYVRSKHERA